MAAAHQRKRGDQVRLVKLGLIEKDATRNPIEPRARRGDIEGSVARRRSSVGAGIAPARGRCVSCRHSLAPRHCASPPRDRAVMTLALLVEQLFNGVQFGLMLF